MEKTQVILCDTGPLVALIDNDEERHEDCLGVLPQVDSLLTTWPCLTEAMYLLGRKFGIKVQEKLWRPIELGTIKLHPLSDAETAQMRRLMGQYQQVPMSLADASLVAVADSLNSPRIFTLDSDFRIYRLGDGRAFEIVPE